MAQPPTYSRAFNFSDYQATSPSTPVPGNKLDEEFSRIKAVIDSIRANLALVQRDDTAIANESIGYDQLKAELDGFGFNPPSEWATSTNYVVRDTVFHESSFYRCLVSHTSGTFATDLAAEKWALIADFTAATSDAETAKTAAEAAQTAAETAQAAAETAESNASDSATAAASSATDASDSADAAAASATNAAASATAAAASASAAATSETNAGTAETAAETAQAAAETAQTAAETAQAAAEAAAAGVNLPSIASGDAGKMLRVNAGETAYELTTSIADDKFSVSDPADSTKKVRLDAGNVTAGNTRVLTAPDSDGTLVINQGTFQLKQSASPTPTAEGDMQWDTDDNAIVVGDGSSQKKFRPNAWELIAADTISNESVYAKTGLGNFRLLHITGWMAPATDNELLIMRTSTDGGSSYDSGSTDYDFQTDLGSNATFVGTRSTAAANFNISCANVGNDTGERVSFDLTITDFNQTAYAYLEGTVTLTNSSGTILGGTTHGRRLEAGGRNAIQFRFIHNIAAGFIVIEGVRG
jgi:hypothetical protein